jgi:hypothetical protein
MTILCLDGARAATGPIRRIDSRPATHSNDHSSEESKWPRY